MKIIEGGVCAAKGFKAGSVRCGVNESRLNDDTAIIFANANAPRRDLHDEPCQGRCRCMSRWSISRTV